MIVKFRLFQNFMSNIQYSLFFKKRNRFFYHFAENLLYLTQIQTEWIILSTKVFILVFIISDRLPGPGDNPLQAGRRYFQKGPGFRGPFFNLEW